MKVSVILIFILISSLSVYPQRDVDALIEYMVGSFSNKEQAVKDSDYFNIEIEIVQIWKDRTDGPWVYVEQAVAEKKEKPYSQRVYQIKQRSDGKIESIIYSIPDPTRFAGDYKKDFPLMRLIPDSLYFCRVAKLF
jgi:CpeT protein